MAIKHASIAEIQQQGELNNLSFAMSAPAGIDFERLDVNMRAFRRMRLVAGLGSVCVENRSTEEHFDFDGSVNADGSISKVKTSAKTKPTTISSGEDIHARLPGSYRPDITIPFSTKAVMQSLGQSKYDTAEEHLAAELSRTLRAGMLEGSNRSHALDEIALVAKVARYNKPIGVFLGGMTGLWTFVVTRNAAEAFAEADRMATVTQIGESMVWHNSLSLLSAKLNGIDTPLHEHKWSLFNPWGVQFDRLAIGQVALRSSRPLVTVRQ